MQDVIENHKTQTQETKDNKAVEISAEILGIPRKNTTSADDKSLVLSALAIAKKLYLLSAPTYHSQEIEQSLSVTR